MIAMFLMFALGLGLGGLKLASTGHRGEAYILVMLAGIALLFAWILRDGGQEGVDQ